MFPTSVLLAFDGSTGSRDAAQMAVSLSNALDSPLYVVLVENLTPTGRAIPEEPYFGADAGYRSRGFSESEVRDEAERQAKQIREQGGRIAGLHHRIGHPVAEILHVAEETDAGLVVVGSRGLGRLRRKLLGSVSEGVVRHAHCAVLVVRGGCGELGPAVPLVLAVDGSRETAPATEAAAEISRATGCTVHLVYALQIERYRPYPGPETWEGWEEDLARAELDATRWLKGHAEDLKAKGARTVEAHLFRGEPDGAILRLVDTLGAGLVVLGSRGLGGIRRAFLGSVSESVMHNAGCPVMIVRRDLPDGADGTENGAEEAPV